MRRPGNHAYHRALIDLYAGVDGCLNPRACGARYLPA
jgi:hypothetical protein